ncbi:MAG: GNAT family N-acetyltransferase [Iodobacter sp.]
MPGNIELTDFEIRIAMAAERPVLFRMPELYQHDLSDVWDQDIDEHGEYGYSLDQYWSDSAQKPYVILVKSKYAGLALVNGAIKAPGGQYWLEQYFIIKNYRRTGLGRAAATRFFDSRPGQWQVGQMPLNLPAQVFWRATINGYTNGNYKESGIESGSWRGVLQEFSTPSTGA